MRTAALGRGASETLSESYSYEFPAATHDVLIAEGCALTVAFDFIEDPVKPVQPCLQHLRGPYFGTP